MLEHVEVLVPLLQHGRRQTPVVRRDHDLVRAEFKVLDEVFDDSSPHSRQWARDDAWIQLCDATESIGRATWQRS